MNKEISVRIAGEAGMGMQTIGAVLCKVFKNAGYHVFAHQDNMSRIRGGSNFFQIRVAGNSLFSPRAGCDILIALDRNSSSVYANDVASPGITVLDRGKFGAGISGKDAFDVPLYRLAMEKGGSELFVNSVACGLLAFILDIEISHVHKVLQETFGAKGGEIVQKNNDAATAGHAFAKAGYRGELYRVEKGNAPGDLLMTGNDAIILGAIAAGCTFYSAYPMSPSTGIMEGMARAAKEGYPVIVEQAEDEIAAINMIIGASFAGVRSMTSTSGGGFALMVEGLSLAGMTETPIVVVDAQRPGPATGFPTRTEQADLNYLIHAGHGEFARVIYAPGTAGEAFVLTRKAFNIAGKYQIPVLIMTDQFLADSSRSFENLDLEREKTERSLISREASRNVTGYQRYKLTESGISPRAVPSWIEEVIYADSDEHTEEGHITEDASMRIRMVDKRFGKKMKLLSDDIVKPGSSGLEKAECILIGFGSSFGVMKEASAHFAGRVGFIHLSQVWPFPSEDVIGMLKDAGRKITVEGNAGAQLAGLMRRETGIKADASIVRYDGRPIDLDYLVGSLKREMR